jgi:hypothetical protein
VSAKVDAADRDWDTAGDAIAGLDAAVTEAKATVKVADEAFRKATETRDQASGQLESAKTQLAAAATDDLRKQWQAEVDKHQATLGGSDGVLKAATADKGEADAQMASAQAALDAGTKAETDAGAAARSAKAQLAKTPEQLDEKVMATFAYDESSWTRTCKATATLAAASGWKSALKSPVVLAGSASTADTEHPGLEKAEVTADPKAFPKDDAALVAEADKAIVEGLKSDLEARIAEYYASRIAAAEATADGDPGATTDALLAVYLAAPKRLGDDGMALVKAHLAETYGLKDPSVLTQKAAPAAAKTEDGANN